MRCNEAICVTVNMYLQTYKTTSKTFYKPITVLLNE